MGKKMINNGMAWGTPGDSQVVRMPSGRLVKSMACGREHCIAVTYDGNAYAWGRGDKAWAYWA